MASFLSGEEGNEAGRKFDGRISVQEGEQGLGGWLHGSGRGQGEGEARKAALLAMVVTA